MASETQGWVIEPTDPRSYESGCFPGPTLWRATLFEAGVPSRVFTAALREDLEWLIADHNRTPDTELLVEAELMAEPAVFGWWGEEGGHRLDAKCWSDGKLELTVTTAYQPPSTVTLANFRALQFWQWINENSDLPTEEIKVALATERGRIDALEATLKAAGIPLYSRKPDSEVR